MTRVMSRIFGIALALALVVACGGSVTPPPASATSTASPAVTKVDGAAAKALVAQGAVLVDVRSPQEFEAGHLAGAINVPVAAVAAHDFGARDTPLVVYCASGGRSARAAASLVDAGHTKVNDLGAMSNWEK
jgi:rhodanese-related sulfurtransferase